jgi:catechol 2,3-dioxygenase-like lactoylglutathione lyase family enzyme
MLTSVSHIALFVPDLQEAERFYKDLFDMELIGQEIEKEDGLRYTLPFNKDGGYKIGQGGPDMTALKGTYTALFRSENLLVRYL